MSPFYLLYRVNLKLPKDESHLLLEKYNKREDPAPFMTKERAKALQETAIKAETNKGK
jgi:hypothetical protein